MSKVSVFMAQGMEEVECLTVVDLLRRGGVEVETISMTDSREVTGSHGITVLADTVFAQAAPDGSDALFLPGGMPGVKNLAAHEGLAAALRGAAAEGRRLAAICAGPSVLGRLGLLEGRSATCYPGWEEQLLGARHTRQGVVTDGNITTARGLGFAVDMGLELIRLLAGEEKARSVRESIQYPG